MIQEDLPFHKEKTCTQCGNTFPETEEYFHWVSKHTSNKLRSRCKICRNNTKEKWYNSINGRWLSVVKDAKKRNKIVDITKEQFEAIVKTPCVYCGKESIEGVKLNALDRVYNDMPYTIDNVVSCCGDCNMLKGSFDGLKFVEMCTNIHRHRQSKGYNHIQEVKSKPLLNTFSRWIKVYLKDSEVGEISKENFEDPVW